MHPRQIFVVASIVSVLLVPSVDVLLGRALFAFLIVGP